MMDAVEAAYESAKGRLGRLTLPEFQELMAVCEVHPVTVDGQTAGALIVLGPEVHACVLPWAHGRWITKRLLRVFDDVVRENGYARTSATTEAGRNFVERLGFKQCADGWWRKWGVLYGR